MSSEYDLARHALAVADNSGGFVLSDNARAAGYRLAGFDNIGSTNSFAMENARSGAQDRLWVAALAQTSGRGRRGRDWQSSAGNLAASLLLFPPKSAKSLSLLGFVAGVALVRTIAAMQKPNDVKPKLKWPNDLLCNGAKLAGILLESERVTPDRQAVVVGIGVNVKSAPQNLPYRATSLSQMGLDCSAQTLFLCLADFWDQTMDDFCAEGGPARMLEEWRANAAGVGQTISVEQSKNRLEGVFETIDHKGHLIVRVASGERISVTAGDILL